MTNNPFVAFLIEIWQRVTTKSPKFFVIWQYITGFITAVTGLPAILTVIFKALNYTPPALFGDLENKTMAVVGLIVYFFSKLPVQPDTASSTKMKFSNKELPEPVPNEQAVEHHDGAVYSKPYKPH